MAKVSATSVALLVPVILDCFQVSQLSNFKEAPTSVNQARSVYQNCGDSCNNFVYAAELLKSNILESNCVSDSDQQEPGEILELPLN